MEQENSPSLRPRRRLVRFGVVVAAAILLLLAGSWLKHERRAYAYAIATHAEAMQQEIDTMSGLLADPGPPTDSWNASVSASVHRLKLLCEACPSSAPLGFGRSHEAYMHMTKHISGFANMSGEPSRGPFRVLGREFRLRDQGFMETAQANVEAWKVDYPTWETLFWKDERLF